MDVDFMVIGGGIAGASAGFHLSSRGTVLVIEMAAHPGTHSTGRSAALYSPYYGNPVVRALTRASRDFLARPPAGFTEHPLLTPRGVLALCPPGAEEQFTATLAEGQTATVPAREIDPVEAAALCPAVRPGWYTRAMLKPDTWDIDVDSLHQGMLRRIRAAGGTVLRDARVDSIRPEGDGWRIHTRDGSHRAPVVVDAAGAWADQVAVAAGAAPVGCVPLRRTACVVDVPADLRPQGWPMVTDVTATFYLKPESGGLLISPMDAQPDPPGDARPDDLDVALGIARVEAATTVPIRRVRHAWAGHRTATADDTPVVGVDPCLDGFVWLAGLSGYGVQTAPALGQLVAAAVGGVPATGELATVAAALSPARFRRPPQPAG
ncbi:FAD-dependent oxidoreductase [Solwaraspora sp. WMMD406]|uniref:NAD(P)/FAD-dependent oxidoreductase n=1 Tax=Solwaraspora sp. WMMD406 TaxID=3016095 RepID=UPI002416D5ED|nr:FAD-dependent oxidoreductase [Solwaraspora sp. WMMD406]MDG4766022.1 FAD-dependent oxidoreductase [Solwaraspora sp. WMMD406]